MGITVETTDPVKRKGCHIFKDILEDSPIMGIVLLLKCENFLMKIVVLIKNEFEQGIRIMLLGVACGPGLHNLSL
jgi:hypothetical protein